MTLIKTLTQRLEESLQVMETVRSQLPEIVQACELIVGALGPPARGEGGGTGGGTIYTAGNGGSANGLSQLP